LVCSLVPGLVLVGLYLAYLLFVAWRNPSDCPAPEEISNDGLSSSLSAVVPPLLLIGVVLGSIIVGAATPTEAAGVGAVGALCLAAYKSALDLETLKDIARSAMATTSMVFLILIGAALFSLVFRGFGGDELIEAFFAELGGGPHTALLIVMLVMFLLGFILFTSSLIEQIPIAALVGVMFMVVIGTFAWHSITTLRKVPRADALVIVTVTIVTVLEDLAIAVVVGVIMSALVYAWNAAKAIQASKRPSVREQGAIVYDIKGPLFFGSVTGFRELFQIKDDPETVIIDFAGSRVVDQSALQAIEDIAAKYHEAGKTVMLRHLSRDCHRLLSRSGQLIIGSDDDPEYQVAVDYRVRQGAFQSGH